MEASPRVEVEYLDFEHPRRWKARSGGSMESKVECTIEPHADGAKVRSELELLPHGFFKLLFPLFGRTLDKHAEDAAEKMRRTLEARYADAAE